MTTKATLYQFPARNALVIEKDDGTVLIEYPATEIRGHQIAQDHGAPVIAFGKFDALVRRGAKK